MTFFKGTPIHTVLLFFFLFLISIKTFSQERGFIINDSIVSSNSTISSKRYLDIFMYPVRNPNPIIYKDTVILYSPQLPVIFDVNHLNLSRPLTPECPLRKPLFPPLSISSNKLFADTYNKNQISRQAYNYLIKNNLRQIKYTTATFSGKVDTLEGIEPNIFQFLFKIDYDRDHENVNKPERFRPKRRYWTFNGDHKVQLSQNFISDNWYKGGVKNLNMLNTHTLSFKYKKNKFESNHIFEWRMSVYTNPNDTIRSYRIGEDLVRTYSNFGLQAFKNWYYSSNIEIKTQLFKNFNQNSDNALSALLSPLYVNIGFLGMRYQIEKTYPKVKGKKLNLSADISPLSIEYITVLNKDIDPKRFGIKEGKRHLNNLGSKLNAKFDVYFNKNVRYTSRFDYFTNYEKVTAEWENKLDMPINRYFSTTFYLYVRYDDNPKLARDRTLGYFQLNELLTFGFSYKW